MKFSIHHNICYQIQKSFIYEHVFSRQRILRLYPQSKENKPKVETE